MDKISVIKYFGSASAVARALGITRSAVSKWGDTVPELSALKLEKIMQEQSGAASRSEAQAA